MYALGNGIPKVLAGVLGGYMTVTLGYTVSMVICSLLCVGALVLFFFTFARSKNAN
jgi:predicted MFS family arabinose efflux permease